MELSEAILKGCEITPNQAFGILFSSVRKVIPIKWADGPIITDQAFDPRHDHMFDITPVRFKEEPSTCVLGAAYEGAIGNIHFSGGNDSECSQRLDGVFPILAQYINTKFPLPRPLRQERYYKSSDGYTGYMIQLPPRVVHTREFSGTVRGAIVTLNDHYRWTREQIAAWVKYVVEGHPMIPED